METPTTIGLREQTCANASILFGSSPGDFTVAMLNNHRLGVQGTVIFRGSADDPDVIGHIKVKRATLVETLTHLLDMLAVALLLKTTGSSAPWHELDGRAWVKMEYGELLGDVLTGLNIEHKDAAVRRR